MDAFYGDEQYEDQDAGLVDEEALELQAELARVNYLAAEATRRVGVQLTPSDPEFESVKWRSASADRFLDSYLAALNAKAARLGIERRVDIAEPGDESKPAKPAKPTVKSLRQAYEAEMRKLNEIGAGTDERLLLRQKYRRQGLDI